MIMHLPNYWVGGYHRKRGWQLAYPLSAEALEISIAYSKSVAVARHRENLTQFVEVYDALWQTISRGY